MVSAINRALMQVPKRAESSDQSTLLSTFVDAGPLFTLLSTFDHQILYGRRGTGKTHAMQYLARHVEEAGDWSIYVDLRQVGSSGGLYADNTIPIPERATRLLMDVLAALHDGLTERALHESYAEASTIDILGSMSALDGLADQITQVRVTGTVETEEAVSFDESKGRGHDVSVGTSGAAVTFKREGGTSERSDQLVRRSGTETHYVHFGAIGTMLDRLRRAVGESKRIWLLLDEWSATPLELQPLLADLLRRSLFPVEGIVVKIAAIEHRSQFIRYREGDYVGIEVGADASANVDLDDFMVFGNNADLAQDFFRELLYRHVAAVMSTERFGGPEPPTDANAFIRRTFTQTNAFAELVRAAEGVPRDAINVLAQAATSANDDLISIENVRSAARRWYQIDKESPLQANEGAIRLLNWIVDEVIGNKRTKGFLLDPSGIMDPLVRALYDGRVLHLIRRGISSRDQPGVRFNAYALDFGCYVHLTAAKAPRTLFTADTDEGVLDVDVPSDDYRSIRTAILDLGQFYNPAASF